MNNMIKFPEPYKYSEYRVEDFINNLDIDKVARCGVRNALQAVLDAITPIFRQVSFMTFDMEYFVLDKNELDNMRKINDMLVQRLLELYAICIIGLGQEDDWKNDET